MTDDAAGWFRAVGSSDGDDTRRAIESGSAPEPRNWPALAVETGFAADEDEYYDRLHEATIDAARAAVREREQAGDQQLIHAVRGMDDCRRQANELAERVSEWGTARFGEDGAGLSYARELTARDPESTADRRVVELARRATALDEEARQLREHVEATAPTVAPNLAALAGPVLAARLLSLAGGLEDLAKKPSGTIQVLGAEEALFAHLRGNAPSPKHGIIYTHEAVSGTRPGDRGSAARALAGKLAIAARIDHYSGDRHPELERELSERIETIQARGDRDD